MKRYFTLIISFAILILNFPADAQNNINLFSPDSTNRIVLKIYNDIQFEVWNHDELIIPATKIDLRLLDSEGDTITTSVSKGNIRIKRSMFTFTNELIYPEISEKAKTISNKYNELELELNSLTVFFRAYNNGIAWQYQSNIKNDVTVLDEKVELVFPSNTMTYFPEESSFYSHNERYYIYDQLDSISTERFCSLPVLIEIPNGKKILISETDLEDYPGMWFKGTGTNALNAIFPGVSLKEDQLNDRSVKVSKYANYIAETKGQRNFPWRIIAIASNDAELITNQLTYQLAQPSAIKDPSWIKPGKVAWDWWNANNIYGVDFKAGVNTETYKYYIDFASKYGIEYIILDEGWYELGDLLKLNPDINMEEIMAYGEEKNVGIILWVVWKTLWDQWEEAFDQIEQWGAKGIKVDFMQRDDQWMVNYYHKVAEESAKRHLLVDFHGSYKPSGLRRKYPNVITREGLRGLEQSKWSDLQTPGHNVTLPFIRMVAGPMDYTPGAMINAQPENFEPVWNRPMSIGTRCHQLAMYVVYESPLQMLADNPSNYYKEPECMEFLSAVPTVWDTTIVLSAKIAEHIIIARKSDKDWFVGCMTNENSRKMNVNLSFLGNNNYSMMAFEDGINADRMASDYRKTIATVSAEQTIDIQLAPGGGWAAWLKIVHD